MENFDGIINWDNLHRASDTFKKNKPFKYAFIEDIFVKDFYEKLYKTYPKIDETWSFANMITKVQYWKGYDNDMREKVEKNIKSRDDPTLSHEWNKFLRYVSTDEFVDHFKKFSGIDVTNCKGAGFAAYKRGGFQLPHIHNVGPSTLVALFYFSKEWKEGEPGGTYLSKKEDESTIFFEPYNLDNTMVIFQDGPKAAHGARYNTKDVVRQAFAINIEHYSPKTGWSGDQDKTNFLSTVTKKSKKSQ